MKKILSLALLLSVTASTFAVEAEINGLWYELISKVKEATVIQYKNNVRYQGFTKVDPGEGAVWGDLNIDGTVDVADIANIIDIMAR